MWVRWFDAAAWITLQRTANGYPAMLQRYNRLGATMEARSVVPG
jgi:hypothetical protein